MRDIKFRGKRIYNGKWVCGWDVGYSEGQGYIYGDYVDNERSYIYEVDPSTVGQYTGLKDKNGVEIYEGDIIRIDGMGVGVVDYEEGRFAMHRKEERFCWPVYCRIDHSPFVPEIIGNIQDHPELLDKEESI